MLLPLILSQIAFCKAAENSRKTMLTIVCGALIAIAIAFKQVAAVNWFLLIALYPAFASPTERWRATLRFIFWSLLGVFAVAGLVSLYFWARHGLRELVENVFKHNLEYIGAMTWSERVHFCAETLARFARTETLVWIVSAVALVGLIVRRDTKRFAF